MSSEADRSRAGGGVFARTSVGLVEMAEQPYAAEADLHRYVAETPALLTGDGAPVRWILVGREVAVADAPDAAGRWSLDHLFVDEDAVPTLVEVKRSSDTRVRREVVGQMLDYAAHASHSWADGVRSLFETACQKSDRDPGDVFAAAFGMDVDAEGFWTRVEENLREGRLRLVFVADSIPDELRGVVEFLNEQMTKTEVLALEVRQFIDGDANHQMLVSRLIGRTQAAQQLKQPGERKWRHWDRKAWVERFREVSSADQVSVMESLFDWAEALGIRVRFGYGIRVVSAIFGRSIGSSRLEPFYLYSDSTVEVAFQHMRKVAPFDRQDERLALLERLNAIEGIDLDRARVDARPSFSLSALEDPKALAEFEAVIESVFERAQSVATEQTE